MGGEAGSAGAPPTALEVEPEDKTLSRIPREDAMMNHVILRHLFYLSTPQQLNNYRLVCKHWYSTSLPAWLQHRPAKRFNSKENFTSFVTRWQRENSNSVHNHNNHAGGGAEGEIVGIRRYRKFHLDFSLYPSQLMRVFRAQVGIHMTHVTVRNFKFRNHTTLNNFLRAKHTPNLEYLEVGVYFRRQPPDDSTRFFLTADENSVAAKVENVRLRTLKFDYHGGFQASSKSFPIPWTEFLSQFPKLKHFEVGRFLSREMSEVEAILKAIKEIREEDKRKLELKSLIWSYNVDYKAFQMLQSPPLPPKIYTLLQETRLQLDSFRIDFSSDESEELVRSLLSSSLFAKSLRKLEIYRFSALTTASPFSGMSQLRSLVVSGYPLRNLDCLLSSLPNLSSLCLWGDIRLQCPYAPDVIRSTNKLREEGEEGLTTTTTLSSFPLLTQFCCNYRGNWTPADICQLQKLMPRLSRLELRLNNESFRTVCLSWPRLEHLSVYGNEIGDFGIVGLAAKGGRIIYSEPNITSLRYLKRFAIEAVDLLHSSLYSKFQDELVTWRSVVHGFSKLPNLERLELDSNWGIEIQELILEEIPFAKVNPRRRFPDFPDFITEE